MLQHTTLLWFMACLQIATLVSLLYADTNYLVKQLYLSRSITTQEKEYLCTLKNNVSPISIKQKSMHIPLFNRYPSLSKHLPHVNLGTFPTPIELACDSLSRDHAIQFYIKNDGACGKIQSDGTVLFGGNKVRKLEFVLADALNQGVATVMTFGGVGSNHALATSCYAKLLGLQSICLLADQPSSKIVQRNLLLQKYYDADLHFFSTETERNQAGYNQFIACHTATQKFPYVIPTGASYPLGTVGFVNAAFELDDQIKSGILSAPDIIYVAAGSLGTLVGLILGCKAARLSTKVVGIAVEPSHDASGRALSLLKTTNEYLHLYDPSFPLFDWKQDDIVINMNFTGPQYGAFTQEAQEAIHFLHDSDNIILDGVYSGKAFAALLNDIKKNVLDNKVVLFWNTFCADTFEHIITKVDYHTLKPEFHRYFEKTY